MPVRKFLNSRSPPNRTLLNAKDNGDKVIKEAVKISVYNKT